MCTRAWRTRPQHALTPAACSPPLQAHLCARPEWGPCRGLWGGSSSLVGTACRVLSRTPGSAHEMPVAPPRAVPTDVSLHRHVSPQPGTVGRAGAVPRGRGRNRAQLSTFDADAPYAAPVTGTCLHATVRTAALTQAYVPPALPPPRPRHPLLPPRAAGAWPSRAPGAGGGRHAGSRPASLPAWRLAHGRGQHGSRLRLIKCPSLMSFSN